MSDKNIDRRDVLKGIGAAGTLSAAAATTASASSSPEQLSTRRRQSVLRTVTRDHQAQALIEEFGSGDLRFEDAIVGPVEGDTDGYAAAIPLTDGGTLIRSAHPEIPTMVMRLVDDDGTTVEEITQLVDGELQTESFDIPPRTTRKEVQPPSNILGRFGFELFGDNEFTSGGGGGSDCDCFNQYETVCTDWNEPCLAYLVASGALVGAGCLTTGGWLCAAGLGLETLAGISGLWCSPCNSTETEYKGLVCYDDPGCDPPDYARVI